MTQVRFLGLFALSCIVVGVGGGAAFSSHYWGYSFARPSIPEVETAVRVSSVTALRAVQQRDGCTLEFESIPDLDHHVAAREKYLSEFPELRALVGLDRRGLLPRGADAPAWLEPSSLHRAVVDAGIVVQGKPGYDTAGCFGGYALELDLPSGESRLLVVAGGPEVSNDHHAYYEVLFKREGPRLVAERARVSFYDIAGIEALEWPVLHGALVILCALIAAATIALLSIARIVAGLIVSARPVTSAR